MVGTLESPSIINGKDYSKYLEIGVNNRGKVVFYSMKDEGGTTLFNNIEFISNNSAYHSDTDTMNGQLRSNTKIDGITYRAETFIKLRSDGKVVATKNKPVDSWTNR